MRRKAGNRRAGWGEGKEYNPQVARNAGKPIKNVTFQQRNDMLLPGTLNNAPKNENALILAFFPSMRIWKLRTEKASFTKIFERDKKSSCKPSV